MRRALRVVAPLLALALLSGQSCDADFGNLLTKPGTITVSNVSTGEGAVLAILADDVKSYPTLAAGQSASVETNVGGRYEVRVVMTPENATAYRAELASLRRLVEKQLDGEANAAAKTQLFVQLAGIKAAIQALEIANAAGCSGEIDLDTEKDAAVHATVQWSPTSGGGFWDATCGSS
jgi:hypothetical protein